MTIDSRVSIRDFLEQALRNLGAVNEAPWVLEFIQGKGLSDLESWNLAHQIISRRQSEEPLAYVLGEWSFLGLSLKVGPGVLIPRPETEELAERMGKALCLYGVSSAIVVDLGAGSGAFGLGVCADFLNKNLSSQVQLFSVEKSVDALELLQKNLYFYEEFFGNRFNTNLVHRCWSAFLPQEKADVVLGNPPYVSSDELGNVHKSVKSFEPHSALVPKPLNDDQKKLLGELGLDESYCEQFALAPLLENLVFASKHLKSQGLIAIEIGPAQVEFLTSDVFFRVQKKLSLELGLERDMSSKLRFLIGKKYG